MFKNVLKERASRNKTPHSVRTRINLILKYILTWRRKFLVFNFLQKMNFSSWNLSQLNVVILATLQQLNVRCCNWCCCCCWSCCRCRGNNVEQLSQLLSLILTQSLESKTFRVKKSESWSKLSSSLTRDQKSYLHLSNTLTSWRQS